MHPHSGDLTGHDETYLIWAPWQNRSRTPDSDWLRVSVPISSATAHAALAAQVAMRASCDWLRSHSGRGPKKQGEAPHV